MIRPLPRGDWRRELDLGGKALAIASMHTAGDVWNDDWWTTATGMGPSNPAWMATVRATDDAGMATMRRLLHPDWDVSDG